MLGKCFYSLFHRDETKPTHIHIDAFLFLMQLIYKHSSPNFQHMTSCKNWSTRNCEDVRKLKHFQPHSRLCHLWCIYLLRYSFMCRHMHIHDHFQSWRSSFDKLLSIKHTMCSYVVCTCLLLHIADCINTAAAAEQSLHHNIILEKEDHPSVSRTCTDNRKTAN